MLDNLRDQASFQEDHTPIDHKPPKSSKARKPRRSLDEITRMTAQQRFALVVMFLIIICLLGVMVLIITGKVVPPFIS